MTIRVRRFILPRLPDYASLRLFFAWATLACAPCAAAPARPANLTEPGGTAPSPPDPPRSASGVNPAAGRSLCRLRSASGANLAADRSLCWRAGRVVAAWSAAPRALALGLLVALVAPSSAHVWWRPYSLDSSVPGSLAAWPSGLLPAMQWVRAHTRRDAVFVTSLEWSAALPILGARRVLHAPDLVATPDGERRARLAYLALAGTGAQGWRQARRYRVTHLFAGPDDLRVWDLTSWDEVEARGRFRLRFEADGFRVYELMHWGTSRPYTPTR